MTARSDWLNAVAIVFGILLTIAGSHGMALASEPLASLPPPIDDTALLQHGSPYSSPYGPRALSGKGYQFHPGVDYAYCLGTRIFAVQGGTLTLINYQKGGAGFYINIKGRPVEPFPGEEFQYMHLFDDSLALPTSPVFQDKFGNRVFGIASLANACGSLSTVTVTVQVLSTQPEFLSDCVAIVFWLNFDEGVASDALSPCPGIPIGPPAELPGEQRVVTRNTISQDDVIAVVGESGAATHHPHLHLQLDGSDKNPLLYVQHDHSVTAEYKIVVFKDKGNTRQELNNNEVPLLTDQTNVLDAVQDSPLRIRAEIDYSTIGHDLDRVEILMYKAGTSVPSLDPLDSAGDICLIDSRCRAFDYGGTGSGGTVSRKHCSSDQPCDALQQNVYPQEFQEGPAGLSHGGGGVVDFLTDPIDLTSLEAGDYIVLVRAISILGEVRSQAVTVRLQKPQHVEFTATATCVGPVDSPFDGGLLTDDLSIRVHIGGPIPAGLVLFPIAAAIPDDFFALLNAIDPHHSYGFVFGNSLGAFVLGQLTETAAPIAQCSGICDTPGAQMYCLKRLNDPSHDVACIIFTAPNVVDPQGVPLRDIDFITTTHIGRPGVADDHLDICIANAPADICRGFPIGRVQISVPVPLATGPITTPLNLIDLAHVVPSTSLSLSVFCP